ncbi:MAG: Uma2 family endonuclease [Candidatus Tectomicrobia bacterium]|nr:Uma2 family endonuclease [Candidatus Tectomicrobia bacterium]
MDKIVIVPEDEEEEFDDMGSHNHSMVQANLAYLFKCMGDYTVFIELSLDVSHLDLERYSVKEDLVPDIALYPKRPLSIPHDILRMTEMPLLIVEILSPRQGTGSILEKFGAYFALGIRSSWLVDPLTQTVHIYQSPTSRTTFSTGDVVDPSLDIHMPISEIFAS